MVAIEVMLPMLAKIAGLLPTHKRRSEESQALQQFSTPITLGLAASTAAAITAADLVLEPSAGTGLLAIFAELAKGALVLNELADVRAGLLDRLFPGVTVFHSGAGVIGSIVVGVLAGGATLAIGQIVFATVRIPIIRALIALLYAAPAAVAGYYATLGLSKIGVPSETWRVIFAAVGSAVVGGIAWARMWAFVPPPYERGMPENSVSVPMIGVARNS